MEDEGKLGNRRSKSIIGLNRSKEQHLSKSSMSRLKLRKGSYGFGSVPGVGPIKTSQLAFEFRRPIMMYLPTYQLDPEEKFNCVHVEQEINEILDQEFTGHKYNPNSSPVLAMKLSQDIMRKIKSWNYDRYRIIAVVTIAQRRAQSVLIAIGMLWDHERDSYAHVVRETNTCYIDVIVFGIYLD